MVKALTMKAELLVMGTVSAKTVDMSVRGFVMFRGCRVLQQQQVQERGRQKDAKSISRSAARAVRVLPLLSRSLVRYSLLLLLLVAVSHVNNGFSSSHIPLAFSLFLSTTMLTCTFNNV